MSFYVRVNGAPNFFFSSVHVCACGVAGGSISHCVQSLVGEFLSPVIFSCGLFVCLLSSVCVLMLLGYVCVFFYVGCFCVFFTVFCGWNG